MSGDPLDCPGCGYDPMAPHNGKGDCAPDQESADPSLAHNEQEKL